MATCQAALNQIPTLANGVYNLTISSTVIPTYCYYYQGLMWALVMKTDGTKATFGYTSSYWTSQAGLNPGNYAGGLDNNEYQSSLYWQMPFSQMLFGMRFPYGGSAIQFVATGTLSTYSSLYSVIQPGNQQIIGLVTRAQWESLFNGAASADLQNYCNMNGFNLQPNCAYNTFSSCSNLATSGPSIVRIGYLCNQENDCGTPDSFIG